MTPCNDDSWRKIDPDDPQRLLIVAYTRPFLLPERPDGSKLTTIASIGTYDVRLIEMPISTTPSVIHPLWIELYDVRRGRPLSEVGCHDLQDAGKATEVFIAEATRLAGLDWPSRPPP